MLKLQLERKRRKQPYYQMMKGKVWQLGRQLVVRYSQSYLMMKMMQQQGGMEKEMERSLCLTLTS